MSTESNKDLVRRFVAEVINTGDTSAITQFCVPGSNTAGRLTAQVRALRITFPDLAVTINDIIAEGDKVALTVTIRGINTGPLHSLPALGDLDDPAPPTGQPTLITGSYMFTLSNGRIDSFIDEFDQVSLLRQLGWTFTPPEQ